MKKCPRCEKKLPNSKFRSNKARKDGLSQYCRDCSREYEKKRYANRTKGERTKINQQKITRRKEVGRKILAYLKTQPCVDCGEDDPVVLDFDHVRGAKSFNLSDARRKGYGWERVLKEIKKCEVRCANCHRRKTAREQGWFT